MNGKRLPQELIEADIQKATSSRDCPATGRECRIPDKKSAESDRLWAEYIQRCAQTHSTEIFSTADRQGFVDCCKDCDIYIYHKYLQNLHKPIKQQNQKIMQNRMPLIQQISLAWDIIKSRTGR